jgi:16S rRNA G966 N2-methylase RsmD
MRTVSGHHMNWINGLYFGDNLKVLRDNIPSESVDLIYLDPPFNSNTNYK